MIEHLLLFAEETPAAKRILHYILTSTAYLAFCRTESALHGLLQNLCVNEAGSRPPLFDAKRIFASKPNKTTHFFFKSRLNTTSGLLKESYAVYSKFNFLIYCHVHCSYTDKNSTQSYPSISALAIFLRTRRIFWRQQSSDKSSLVSFISLSLRTNKEGA